MKIARRTMVVVSALSVALIIGFSGCAKKAEEITTLTVDGSSTVFPITEAVAEEFQKANPTVQVTVGISGTGGGFKKFGAKETDMSDASRPIKKSEAEAAQANGVSYIEMPVAYDGLAVLVNPANDWVDYLTVKELKMIWEPEAQGKIMKWSDVRPEWPNEKLSLFGPGVDSGTFDYFTEVIVGKSQSSRGDFTASEDDNILVQGVAGDKYSLGFFGLAYFEENADKLKLVAIDDEKAENGAGAVLPSLETVIKGTYEPLARPLFIYANMSSLTEKKALTKFIDFYLENAAVLSKEVGYIPLPEEVYTLVKNRFKAKTAGSPYLTGNTSGKTLAEIYR